MECKYLSDARYSLYEHHLRQGLHGADLTMIYAGTEDPLEPGYVSGPIIRDCFIIQYCRTGGGRLLVDNRSYSIRAGECYVLFPWCKVTLITSSSDPWAKTWVCLWGRKVYAYLHDIGLSPENPVFPWRDNRPFLDYMLRIVREYEGRELTEFELNIHANRLMQMAYELNAGKRAPVRSQARYVEQALRYIEQNFASPINAKDIAAHLNLNRTYFSTLFKEQTGRSPMEYLTDYRIEKSCEFMRNVHVSLSDVARSIGYEPPNFTRLFKRAKGMTPAEYRRQLPQGGGL